MLLKEEFNRERGEEGKAAGCLCKKRNGAPDLQERVCVEKGVLEDGGEGCGWEGRRKGRKEGGTLTFRGGCFCFSLAQ